MSARSEFRAAYALARRAVANGSTQSAYTIANNAVDARIYDGADVDTALDVLPAVLWAIHWRFRAPINTPPLGLSERHLGFSATPDGTTTWFARKLH